MHKAGKLVGHAVLTVIIIIAGLVLGFAFIGWLEMSANAKWHI